MSEKLKCPFCGAELKVLRDLGTPVGLFCPKHCKTRVAMDEEIWKELIEGKKAQNALKVANKAIDSAKRFISGIHDKKFEMQKATSASHIFYQAPLLAALCMDTINNYEDEIKKILE